MVKKKVHFHSGNSATSSPTCFTIVASCGLLIHELDFDRFTYNVRKVTCKNCKRVIKSRR
jgi:hypothetical protein